MDEISLNILDLTQNSIKAGAALIEIEVDEDTSSHTLSVIISDNGCGMPAEKKRIPELHECGQDGGMGLPLFKLSAEMSGGSVEIDTKAGSYTRICGRFGASHLPLGDIASTMRTLIICNPSLDFAYRHIVDGSAFSLDTRKMREILCEVPLDSAEVSAFLKDYLIDGENEIGGVLKYGNA